MIVGLLAVALLLYALNLQQEEFVDRLKPVTRPERNAEWLSKINSQGAISGNDDDYIQVLQSFYDTVYAPATVKPTDTDLDAFLKSPAVVGRGLDEAALRKIISSAFRVEIATPITRPARNAEWLSKIDAQAPIGGNDDDYIRVLQSFYDTVYARSAVKPKDTDVEAFLKTPAVVSLGLDEGSLRKIISNGFKVEITTPAAAREQKEVKFQPTEALFPKMGVDEVRTRTEAAYKPADVRKSTEFSEGIYKPTVQQNVPRNPGEFNERSDGWTKQKFYSVCEGSACTENVL